MMAERALEYQPEQVKLPPLDLAAHIASAALSDPTYSIEYTDPSLIEGLVKELQSREELDVQTPTVYARGSNVGRLALRVRQVQPPLAKVIPFPPR